LGRLVFSFGYSGIRNGARFAEYPNRLVIAARIKLLFEHVAVVPVKIETSAPCVAA
jgi:hypothetical protein